jgi:hypothetical protein
MLVAGWFLTMAFRLRRETDLMIGREMPTRRMRIKAMKRRRKDKGERTRWCANGKWKWSRRVMVCGKGQHQEALESRHIG